MSKWKGYFPSRIYQYILRECMQQTRLFAFYQALYHSLLKAALILIQQNKMQRRRAPWKKNQLAP